MIIRMIFIFAILSITTSAAAKEKNYLNMAHQNGIERCDVLIEDNFSFFNYLQDDEYHIETSTFKAPDGTFKTIRYSFNSGYVDPILGDLSVIQTDNFCQSFITINMIDTNVNCEIWKQANGRQWNDIEKGGMINWASNGKYKALFQSINEGRGCQVNFYITNISETES